MLIPVLRPAVSALSGLLLGFMIATPGLAAPAPEARLVNCNDGTCLRISGHRSHAAVAVRIAGRDVPVEGGRSWRATMPLSRARDLANPTGDMMTVTLADPQTGAQNEEAVVLPPGALGKHIELASLIVRAH